MKETNIKIPSYMLEAGRGSYNAYLTSGEGARRILQSALACLVEEMKKSEGMYPCLSGTYQDGWCAAWRHIIHMFSQPEPEIPEEIKDFLFVGGNSTAEQVLNEYPKGEIDKIIIEAYNRGKAKK